LGTTKYPDEASFDEFMSKHDGSNNAYTEQERTVFYNEISEAGLDEGMDRFAQFFIAPTFQAKMVGRELDAVNSEHMKNVPNQGRRLWELMRSTASNKSVVSHFYTGTTESLHHGDNTTIAALRKYHEENYCAPRMTLVVISNRPLKEQMQLAHNHFDAVARNAGTCSPTARDFKDDHPYADASSLGRRIEFHSDSAPQLWMMFPMPPVQKSYKAQPASMLEYMVGYAGPKSLTSQLKSQGLVSKLGMQVDTTTAGTLVFVTFDLTPAGTKDPDAVTNVVFDYLAQVRGNTKEIIKGVYPTMKQMSLVTFDYQEAPDSVMDSVSSLAASLLTYDAADVLAGDFAIDQADYELVEKLAQSLSPSNVNLAISMKTFDEAHEANRFNKYYNVHYADKQISQTLRTRWEQPKSQGLFQMPPALKYVPSKLDLISASAGEIPKQLKSETGAEVWWLGRGNFPLPKAQFRVKLTAPKALFASSKYVAMRRLHVGLLQRVLEEPMEDMGNCGLDWEIKDISDGYHMAMNGYDQHLVASVKQVAGSFSQDKFNEKDFNAAKQQLVDDLSDTTSKMVYEHAMEAMNSVTSNSAFSRESVLASIESIDMAAFSAYLGEVKKQGLRAQLLATGNLDEAATGLLASALTAELGTKMFLSEAEAAQVTVLDAKEPIEVRMSNPIPNDPNSATINAYQYGVPDVAERVKVLMLGKMISEPVYNTLRTKDQLGYVVFGLVVPHRSILELQLIVQGAKEGPDSVDLKIEGVLDDFGQSLRNLTHSQFATWKASVRSSIDRQDQNMAQECDRFWAQIVSGDVCFNRKQMALDYLASFDKPEELASEFNVFRNHPRKISVRMFGSKAPLESSSNATQKSAASLILRGDGAEEKASAAKGRSYWPTSGICQVHRK
jgi:insulysin